MMQKRVRKHLQRANKRMTTRVPSWVGQERSIQNHVFIRFCVQYDALDAIEFLRIVAVHARHNESRHVGSRRRVGQMRVAKRENIEEALVRECDSVGQRGRA